MIYLVIGGRFLATRFSNKFEFPLWKLTWPFREPLINIIFFEMLANGLALILISKLNGVIWIFSW
jgi:hypothetical protein